MYMYLSQAAAEGIKPISDMTERSTPCDYFFFFLHKKKQIDK